VVGLTLALTTLLPPRAALLHVGAALGLTMVLNVAFVIIPGQRAMVAAMTEGRPPPLERAAAGALRSLHNNYFTLPVLFVMVSHHFPFVVGHRLAPFLLLGLFACAVLVKHWMNLRERDRPVGPGLLAGAALGVLGLAWVGRPPERAQGSAPSMDEVAAVLTRRCAPCHSASPTFTGITTPPNGFVVDDRARLPALAPLIRAHVVDGRTMPLGNVTSMTEEERSLIARWLDAGAPVESP
jgi:uncharacterized membrane protein